MGAVYLVRHVRTDEMLALKLLHSDVLKDATAVERFRREARAPAKIASEHVARVTDADTAPELNDAPFYVMEYLRGRDLEKTITEEGPLAPSLVAEYMRQTARALDKAHALGIIHRDLKPENLFLTHRDDGSPCIKLLDFGIARLGDTGAVNPLKTQAGYIFGTPAFMSPEQALGDIALIGPATDVWAYGLVAFKLLVGRDYWGEHPTARLCAMILTGPIPAPSERGSSFGPAFDAWFAKCVARSVEDRFRSANEASLRLSEALGVRATDPLRPLGRPSVPPAAAAVTERSSYGPPPGASLESTGTHALPTNKNAAPIVLGILAVVALVLIVGGLVFARAKPSASADLASSTQKVALADAGSGIDPSTLAVAPIDSAPDGASLALDLAHTDPSHAKAVSSASSVAARSTTAPTAHADDAPLSRDQKHRLESLQRMCDQGTFTPSECQAKRAQISHAP